MVRAYRTTVSRPDKDVEARSMGSGPVKTTKMSSEEMEDYFARIADRIPAQSQKQKKGSDATMKSTKPVMDSDAQSKRAQARYKDKQGPDKEVFLKSIATGKTIAATERDMGLSVNGLGYWIKKWGLVGITPGKARALLEGKSDEDPIKLPEDIEIQNVSQGQYEQKLAEWDQLEQELQLVQLNNETLSQDVLLYRSRCQELEDELKKWNELDTETQELLLEIASERNEYQNQAAELRVLLAEMTEDRDNWMQTAQEAKQAIAELQEEYQKRPSDIVMGKLEPNPHYDPVNHPDHYTAGGIETIDFIRAKLTPVEFVGYCKGNVIKYLARSNLKGGIEDLRKAGKYIEFATKEA